MSCSAAKQEAVCGGCHCSETGLGIGVLVVNNWVSSGDSVLFCYYFFFSFLAFVFLGFLSLFTKLSSSQPTFLSGTILILSPMPLGQSE